MCWRRSARWALIPSLPDGQVALWATHPSVRPAAPLGLLPGGTASSLRLMPWGETAFGLGARGSAELGLLSMFCGSGGREQLVDGRGGEDLLEDTLDLVGGGGFDSGAGCLGLVGELGPQQLHHSPDAGGVGTYFTATL